MDDMNYSGTDVEYEEEKEKKGFKLTRGMLILIIAFLIVIFVIVIIILSKKPKNKTEKYNTKDFEKLESRMKEEAALYVQQNFIELNSEKITIDLKSLLYENGGTIDSSKVKASKVCDGYVIAYKNDSEIYEPYIKCEDLYTTKGYREKETTTTTKTTTTKKDNKEPNIIIIGDSTITLQVGDSYNELGADATDEEDGDISSSVKISGTVDTQKAGTYIITYSVTDSGGKKKEAKRTVIVQTRSTTTKTNTTSKVINSTTRNNVTTSNKPSKVTTPPKINLSGSTVIKLVKGASYNEPGYSAYDALGNNITTKVTVNSNINTSNPGTYSVKYYVTDNYGNSTSSTRTVIVEDKYIALSGITLSRSGTVDLKIGSQLKLTVNYTPSNASNKNITWSTNNSSVATVSNGTVYAKSSGTATITALGADGKKASVIISVIK